MRLSRTKFDTSSIEENGMGAGVVPVAVAHDSEYRVLLGRERFMPQWKGSCRWSGFEGTRKEGEKVIETAFREYTEESLGEVTPKWNEKILQEQYWRLIVLRIENDRNIERYHSTYVIRVPWDDAIPERFLQTRMKLENLDRAAQEWRYSRPVILGDSYDVRISIGPVLSHPEGGVSISRVVSIGMNNVYPWADIEHFDGQVLQTAHVTGEAALGMLAWNRHRERTEQSMVEHMAVNVRRCTRWNLLQSATVSRDFLEKDQMCWWTLHELRRALENRGNLGTHRFRPYFLPVLQTLLQELMRTSPSSASETIVS